MRIVPGHGSRTEAHAERRGRATGPYRAGVDYESRTEAHAERLG